MRLLTLTLSLLLFATSGFCATAQEMEKTQELQEKYKKAIMELLDYATTNTDNSPETFSCFKKTKESNYGGDLIEEKKFMSLIYSPIEKDKEKLVFKIHFKPDLKKISQVEKYLERFDDYLIRRRQELIKCSQSSYNFLVESNSEQMYILALLKEMEW